MSLILNNVVVRSETRVRLIFNGALASGAFLSSLYVLTDLTVASPGPAVVAAIAVAGGVNNEVELVLSTDLATGHSISVQCNAVPGADLTTFTGSIATYWGPNVNFVPNVEPLRNTGEDLVFGRDLVHTGMDYLEGVNGDLASVGGVANVQGALYRRVKSYGLPWDQSYGPKLDDYVDGPGASIAPATGLIKQNILADDRVLACAVSLEVDDTKEEGAFFRITPTLKTDRKLAPFDVAVTDTNSSGG